MKALTLASPAARLAAERGRPARKMLAFKAGRPRSPAAISRNWDIENGTRRQRPVSDHRSGAVHRWRCGGTSAGSRYRISTSTRQKANRHRRFPKAGNFRLPLHRYHIFPLSGGVHIHCRRSSRRKSLESLAVERNRASTQRQLSFGVAEE